MENIIIVSIIVILTAAALLRAQKHFSGGGCCGGGSNTIRAHKKLTEPIIEKKTITVEGMHCKNCEIRVENAVNRIDGVVCRVNLRKKTAIVSYSKEVPDSVLKEAVERLGYKIISIQ